MAYYLMVEKKRGVYQPLNISSSKYYLSRTKSFNKPCAHSLQEIDEFTMLFDDETELRKRLNEEGILPCSLLDKPLSIRLPKNGTYKKVPHDFLYQNDIEYIMEPERLISLIMKRYHQNDFIFIRKLASYFSEVHECSTTAPEVARLSEASIFQGRRHSGLEELDKNGDIMVARMIKLLILKHYENPNGTIDYKDKVNYRNLHDLIAFINNYNKKNTTELKQPQAVSEESKETKKEAISPKIKEQPNIIIAKKRVRSKKKYDIEGQQSFDI